MTFGQIHIQISKKIKKKTILIASISLTSKFDKTGNVHIM